MRRESILLAASLSCTIGLSADINLGKADSIAVDQPRVIFQFTLPGTDIEVGDSLWGLLDTGANGVLLAQQAFDFFSSNPHDPYTPALNSDGQPVVYYESGVAGFEQMYIYEVYDLQFAGWPGAPPHSVNVAPNIRFMGMPHKDLGLPAIIGMPAMAGRVVAIDPKPITYDFLSGFDFTNAEFYDSPPPSSTPVSYTINLPMLPYEHAGVDPDHPDDPRPTFADLPLIDIKTVRNGVELDQRLLLDTGAQTSIISMSTALALGIDLRPKDEGGDIEDYLAVGGIGGTVEMPMVFIDRLIVPTNEGDNLISSEVLVGVLDIIGIDGVLGMDFLMNGYADHIFGGTGEYGAFSEIILDFRNPEMGVMRLDMNPEYVVPEPSSLALIGVFSMLLGRRRPRQV